MFNSLVFITEARREMFNILFLLERQEGRYSTVCFYYRNKKGDVQQFVFITEARRPMFKSVFITETRREMFNSLFLIHRQEGRYSTVYFY